MMGCLHTLLLSGCGGTGKKALIVRQQGRSHMRAMQSLRAFLTFASDAQIMAAWGAGFVAIAVLASLAERYRMKNARIDRLGWMPWTSIFALCAIIGGGLLMYSLPAVIAG